MISKTTDEIERAKKALATLLIFSPNGTSEEREAKRRVMWNVLARLPPKSVLEACEYAARGGLGKLAFLEPGDLYRAAQEFSARDYSRSARRRLDPPEPPLAREPIVAAGLQALARELGPSNSPGQRLDDPKWREKMRGPIHVSDALSQWLKKWQ